MSFGIRPDLTRLLDSRYTFDLPWSREEAKYGPATNSINSPLGSSTTQPSPTPLPEEADALSMTPSAVQVSLAQARLDESRPDEGHVSIFPRYFSSDPLGRVVSPNTTTPPPPAYYPSASYKFCHFIYFHLLLLFSKMH